MDDELLREFVNESREHLVTIEADLLTIEEGGDDIDEELVNKVFRAAHSIKGGSGFFGLTKVKELAHKAETVLDMLRSRKMAPNAEVTNLLLAAFDQLRDMINNCDASESADIEDLVTSLTALAASYLPGDEKAVLAQTVSLATPGGHGTVVLPKSDFERVKRCGQHIYAVDYDLIHDIEKRGQNVLRVFHDLMATGEVLDCELDFDSVGTLDGPIGNVLPLRMVFATIIEPDIADSLFDLPKEKVHLLFDPRAASAQEAPKPSPDPVAVAPAVPVPLPEAAVEVPAAPQPVAKPVHREPTASASAGTDDTLRVNVGLLEMLMNLAGELVLSRNQLHAAVANGNSRALSIADQRINQVTTELQDAIMQTRLQPVGNVFGKFPRVVRDMAGTLSKEIQLDIRGKDVALDKSMIEGLSDPLTHMVRNSVDHGIESPQDRRLAGKSAMGTIRIEAKYEAGQVVVEIEDDGKGIDPKKVADSALSKGLITADKLKAMSDQDKVALIFLPGLSTAAKVTDISGRGVGMDVVKTNLDRLGGKVEVKSELGKGSLFRIKLPLTLAIIPSLIVSVEGERFAIPQINVEELLRIAAEDVKRRIEVVGDAEVLLLRDRLIPLVHFGRVLGVTPTYLNPETGQREIDRRALLADRRSPRHDLADGIEQDHSLGVSRSDGRRARYDSDLEIAVVTTGTLQYGLVVDSFHDTEEIVVKPLGRHLKLLREYAGATILGDGTVALILDIAGLAAKANLSSVSGTTRALQQAREAERERSQEAQALLLFLNGSEEPCAIPLSTVSRVEGIAVGDIEHVGGRRTMQYRGGSLPLVTLADTAQVGSVDEARNLAVIVSTVHGREVGLLGNMPVDVIETKVDFDTKTHRQKGIAGSAIIRDCTTLMTDLVEIVDAAYPEWNDFTPASSFAGGIAASAPPRATVLLAEDSDFFRRQVKTFLEEGGLNVLDAPDGEAAWELLLQNLGAVTLVVTDVEMPRLTGLGLAQRIRADERTALLPIIALTSLAGEEDIVKGKAAGITDYQVKLDRDRLIEGVRALLP